jgi:heme oxygenase
VSLAKAPVSLRTAVRAGTSTVHQRLEARLAVEHGRWTLDRYIAFLRGTLSIVAPIEPVIEHHLESRGYRRCEAAERLRHDLRAVGVDADSAPAVRVPALDDAAAAFGAAYVLVGARLGGQIIARILAVRLGLEADQLTYLAPPGVSVVSSWRAFVAALDTYGAATDQLTWRRVADTAVGTFESFEHALYDAGALDVA